MSHFTENDEYKGNEAVSCVTKNTVHPSNLRKIPMKAEVLHDTKWDHYNLEVGIQHLTCIH